MIPSCFSLDHWVDNISLPPPRRNTLKREPDVKKKNRCCVLEILSVRCLLGAQV